MTHYYYHQDHLGNICSLAKVFKLFTSVRLKSVKNSPSPKKTLERHIKILRDAGLIEYKGSKKTGGYYIVHDRNASNEGITEGITEGINTADTNKE